MRWTWAGRELTALIAVVPLSKTLATTRAKSDKERATGVWARRDLRTSRLRQDRGPDRGPEAPQDERERRRGQNRLVAEHGEPKLDLYRVRRSPCRRSSSDLSRSEMGGQTVSVTVSAESFKLPEPTPWNPARRRDPSHECWGFSDSSDGRIRLISVRSVVQIYPGPLCKYKTRMAWPNHACPPLPFLPHPLAREAPLDVLSVHVERAGVGIAHCLRRFLSPRSRICAMTEPLPTTTST